LITLPDYQKTRRAIEKLDLRVVMDLFLTETAKAADIVLPACSHLERSGIGYVYAVTVGIPYLMARKKVIEPLGDCWPDWKFWSELARRMGYGELFPWRTDEELVDFWLKPSGLTREQLTEQQPEACSMRRRNTTSALGASSERHRTR